MAPSVWVRLLVMVGAMLLMGRSAAAQVDIRVSFAPPEIPVYEQPVCPGEGYIWTPGYWAWDEDGDDYYWVPGTWVLAPEPEYLWTPPYWGWVDGFYIFHAGYWGPHVGFYGGVVYGFGYYGHGYDGGRWEHGHFFYNRYVNNVNVTVIHNVYETRVENRYDRETRVSYNGGRGGVEARPTSEEEAYGRERHMGPTSVQTQHYQVARTNRDLRASENRGKPPIAATARPAELNGRNVVAARSGGNYTPPPNRGNRGETNRPPSATESNRPPNAGHAKDLPPLQRGTPPNTGNAKMDQKYQQQQQRLYDKQNQERQQLQQRQEQEHQKFQQQQARQAQQQANQARQQQMQQRQQQMEQRHQQQTQQMQQRHEQQQQRMQQRQQPPPSHGGQPQHH